MVSRIKELPVLQYLRSEPCGEYVSFSYAGWWREKRKGPLGESTNF
jgi:hypothetical protein